MPQPYKVEFVKQLKEKLQNSEYFVLLNYRGLTVEKVNELRRSMRKANAEYKVIKNNLFKIALKELDYPNFDDVIKGPTACVFTSEDIATPIKILLDFAKENKGVIDPFAVYLDNAKYGKEQIVNISKLPTLDTVRAQIMSGINAPATKIAMMMKEVIASLARGIEQVAKKNNKA